jgi:spore maturation protein CgeB
MFDRSYFAERNVVKALNDQGLDAVHWLPPAFYEGVYRPVDSNKDLDFSFIGQPDNTVVRKGLTRKEFVERVGTELNGVIVQGVFGEAVNALYNRSRILFDRTIYNNVGTRIFETIGSGGFVLANKGSVSSGLETLAIDGHHYVSYDDSYDDFIKKARYYIQHEEERKKIATAGYKHFLKNHTYANRIDTILGDFGL